MILNDIIKDVELSKILDDTTILASETYKSPPPIITIDGTTVSTLDNFSALTGKAKAKKTYLVSGLVAAALSGEQVLQFCATLPKGKEKILYIDTEQSRYHCHRVLTRILKMAECRTDYDHPNLDFISLREYTSVIRMQVIDYVLRTRTGYGLVIIDGLRDLLVDINSVSESVVVINKLMEWSSRYELHIHVVLHLNKGDDKVRGHLGTELNNKAESVLVVTRNASDGNVSEVHPVHVRDKEFKPFAFRIDENGLPVTVGEFTGSSPAKKKKLISYTDLTMEQHIQALDAVFSNGAIRGYQAVIDALTQGYASIGFERKRTVITQLFQYLQQELALIQKVDKSYIYVKDEEVAEDNFIQK
jgi:hypothetical protein